MEETEVVVEEEDTEEECPGGGGGVWRRWTPPFRKSSCENGEGVLGENKELTKEKEGRRAVRKARSTRGVPSYHCPTTKQKHVMPLSTGN